MAFVYCLIVVSLVLAIIVPRPWKLMMVVVFLALIGMLAFAALAPL